MFLLMQISYNGLDLARFNPASVQ